MTYNHPIHRRIGCKHYLEEDDKTRDQHFGCLLTKSGDDWVCFLRE